MGKRGKHSALASELLHSLFAGFSGGGNGKKQPEWFCSQCNASNFASRGVCRGCKPPRSSVKLAAANKSPSKSTVSLAPGTKAPALAPWASPEMIQERAGKLEVVIAASEAAGGCEQIIVSLQRELDAQRKKEAAPVSVLKLIEGTKSFITRAEKRHVLVTEQIAELMKEQSSMEKELSEAEERLKRMEEEAADLLNCRPAPYQITTTGSLSVDSLLQNCASLLQAIESAAAFNNSSSTNLPPNVLEAMRTMHTNVAQLRPLPPPTKDGPLEPAEIPAVVVIDSDSLMEEMDDADITDDKLLESAKRLRAKRLRSS